MGSMPSPWNLVPGSKPIESGQAFVFQVQRRDDPKVYALKRWKNPKRIDRFEREFTRMSELAALEAPVPPVIDHRLDDPKPWYVMPWCDEGSLDSLVEGDRSLRTTQERIEIVDEVARALSMIHEHGIAHRDIESVST